MSVLLTDLEQKVTHLPGIPVAFPPCTKRSQYAEGSGPGGGQHIRGMSTKSQRTDARREEAGLRLKSFEGDHCKLDLRCRRGETPSTEPEYCVGASASASYPSRICLFKTQEHPVLEASECNTSSNKTRLKQESQIVHQASPSRRQDPPALSFFSRFLPPSSDSLSNNNSLVSVLEHDGLSKAPLPTSTPQYRGSPPRDASLLPLQAPLCVSVITALPAPERQVMAWGVQLV
ncbi:hypothetical protein B0H16DRAFT_1477875 [Mycena metata]|uniref:Uncharacterized protein n=1 Tax=Mycena metata TaxID=1033252 RepID=A0AAD7MFP1_9AGAR|nr:hypothetical protein B0H16DRAFT_1477875 [Mycena metata]